jgi:flagellin
VGFNLNFQVGITARPTQSNLSAALSTIQDTDVAAETAKLAREQVLGQAGASVLAQAYQAPQLALKLLGG